MAQPHLIEILILSGLWAIFLLQANELTPSEIIRMWRRSPAALRVLPGPLQVTVPRLSAGPFRDIVDAILAVYGPDVWNWRDSNGEERSGQSLARSLAGIANDAVHLPWLYWRHYRRASACLAIGKRDLNLNPNAGCLYLRMDQNFDLNSGGSVAHTAGVINAFRALLPRIQVVSTDKLALVSVDDDFQILTPKLGVGRNLPGFPYLNYTCQVADWWTAEHRERVGFIYARDSIGNYAGPDLRRRLRVPYVCEFNGSAIWIARNWDGKPLRFERLMQHVENVNLKAADLIVVVSEVAKEELIDRGFDEQNIMVNPNGVDCAIFRPDIDKSSVRNAHGIAADELVVGFIGTFGKWHGAEVLADAFGRMAARRPDLRSRTRLLLIGDGMTMPLVQECIERHAVGDRVVFAGSVAQSEGPAYLAACDVLVSPHVPNPDQTRFFGSPTKLFEYMAMGRAIVASDLEQIGEVLEHASTGWLVKPGSAQELAHGLEHLLDNPALRARLGASVRQVAERQHSWYKHAKRIVDRLSELCDA